MFGLTFCPVSLIAGGSDGGGGRGNGGDGHARSGDGGVERRVGGSVDGGG